MPDEPDMTISEPGVRIVCPSGIGVSATVLVNGKELEGVTAISWSLDGAFEFARATIELEGVAIEAGSYEFLTRWREAQDRHDDRAAEVAVARRHA